MSITRPWLLLILLTFAVYFSSFFNIFVWDDEQFIYNNVFVQNFDVKNIFTTNTVAGAGELSNYYRPITTLSFAWDAQLWGLQPFGFHLTNTFLHIGTGLLLYYLLKQLTFPERVSFYIALFFLLHPLQTEAVTYINSRGDSMYSFFGVASLLSLVLYLKKRSFHIALYNLEISINRWFLGIATTVLYILSILGKEIGIAVLGLQVLVFLYYVLFIYKKNIVTFFKKEFLSVGIIIVSILAATIYLFLRNTALNFNNSFNFYNDESIYSQSLLVRIVTFTKIIFTYLRLLFLPYPLHMERSSEIITNPLNIWVLAVILLVAVILYSGIKEIKQKKTGYIFFGWGWFFCMLLPVSGIVPINGLLYEHWLYMPMIGFYIALYGLYVLFFHNLFLKHIQIVCVIILVIFSALTIRQNCLWNNPIRFYTYLLQHTESARIHNNLAMALSEDGRYEEAITEYKKALEYGIPYPNIYHNLANTYSSLGEQNEAEKNYLKALEVDPLFFHSYNSLIRLYIEQEKYDQAFEIIRQAQTYFPTSADYFLLELSLLKEINNIDAFTQRKRELQEKYQSEPKILRAISQL